MSLLKYKNLMICFVRLVTNIMYYRTVHKNVKPENDTNVTHKTLMGWLVFHVNYYYYVVYKIVQSSFQR